MENLNVFSFKFFANFEMHVKFVPHAIQMGKKMARAEPPNVEISS